MGPGQFSLSSEEKVNFIKQKSCARRIRRITLKRVLYSKDEYGWTYIFGDSLVTQLAEDVGALMVALENRYYGQSRPTP